MNHSLNDNAPPLAPLGKPRFLGHGFPASTDHTLTHHPFDRGDNRDSTGAPWGLLIKKQQELLDEKQQESIDLDFRKD